MRAVVVGSGATGGFAAKLLAESGHEVFVLDKAPPHTFQKSDLDKILTPTNTEYFQAPELYVNEGDEPYVRTRGDFKWVRGGRLGGRTLTWGSMCLRWAESDLLGSRGENAWPLSYRDLAAGYELAEQAIPLAGRLDGLSALPDSRYSVPIDFGATLRRLSERLDATPGEPLRMVPQRVVVDFDPKSRAFGLPTKRMSIATTLLDAERAGASIVPSSIVSSLIFDANGQIGKVTGFERETGDEFEIECDAVFLCASSFETVRLLLLSGVKNPHLGAFLADHCGVLVECEPQLDEAPDDTFSEFYGEARGFVVAPGERVSDHGRFTIQGVAYPGRRGARLLSFGEGWPRAHNRITLSSQRDAWGIPVPEIHWADDASHERTRAAQQDALFRFANRVGLNPTKAHTFVPGQCVHEVGGARMGTDPGTSVVDPQGQVWGHAGAFVLDGACWPTLPPQNPTLTMMAIAASHVKRLLSTPAWAPLTQVVE